MRFESIDLPEPGGPIMRTLWPPATATSMARLTMALAFYIAKIDIVVLVGGEKPREIGRVGSSAVSPRKKAKV